jgi:hypothetical protein
VLPHTITGAIALRIRPAARAREQLLTEREFEDAATPSPQRTRESFIWFSKSNARLLPNARASLQDAIYTQPFHLVFAEQGMKCSFNIFSR